MKEFREAIERLLPKFDELDESLEKVYRALPENTTPGNTLGPRAGALDAWVSLKSARDTARNVRDLLARESLG